jgi:hypothetical protein
MSLGGSQINPIDANFHLKKRFINLSADCASLVPNGTIGVTLHTSEPFFGSLYSRDHPSSCKCVGNGGTSTKLVVTLGQDCGVQTISQRAGKLVAISEKVNLSICYRFLNLKVKNYRDARFFSNESQVELVDMAVRAALLKETVKKSQPRAIGDI